MYARLESKYDYRSSIGVLPPLDSQLTKSDKMTKLDEVTLDAIEKIKAYIQLIAYQDKSGDGLGSWPNKFSQLTKDQAFIVLRNIHEQCNITGALHLPDLNAIIFQCNEHTHSLRYAQDPEYRMLFINFDFDNGFSNSNNSYTHQDNVTKILQEYYLTWMRNGRHGFVIPPTEQKLENAFVFDTRRNDSNVEYETVKQTAPQKEFESIIYDRHSGIPNEITVRYKDGTESVQKLQDMSLSEDKKREIESVTIPDVCKQYGFPCTHDVTVKYKDGKVKKKTMTGTKIFDKYNAYLGKQDGFTYQHFSDYGSMFYYVQEPTASTKDSNKDIKSKTLKRK